MALGTHPYLVVARVGDNSLHRQWLSGRRNFDLALDYYGDETGKWSEDADLYRQTKGAKWPALSQFVQENRELVDGYECVWFPDDDLLATGDVVSDMFELTRSLGVGLAQPAL